MNDRVIQLMTTWQQTATGFGHVWQEVGPVVETFVRQRLRNRVRNGCFRGDDADAVQEATQRVALQLLELPRKNPKVWFDPSRGRGGPDAMKAWLYGFARNAVAEYCVLWKGAKKGTKVLRESDLPLNERDGKEIGAASICKAVSSKETLDDREIEQILHECINALPDGLDNLIRLKMKDQLSQREVAARVGLSVSMVHRRLKTARVLLREMLENRGVDGDWFMAA